MDPNERGHQVRRMADIFSKASRVVVWLGLESDDSDTAMDCMEKISSHIEVNFDMFTMRSTSDEVEWADVSIPLPFEPNELEALSKFLNRDWFERLWVVQEVLLASTVVVFCGSRQLPWLALQKSVVCLRIKSDSRKVNCYRALDLCLMKKGFQFNDLINYTAGCKCSDPRDRVFALLALTRPLEELDEIDPSYAKSAYELYQETMLHCSQSSGNLHLLRAVETDDDSQQGPSWVPDWSTERRPNRLPRGFAGGVSEAMLPGDIGHVLPVTGVIVGQIEAVESLQAGDYTTRMTQVLPNALSNLGFKGLFNTGSKIVRDLSIVITADSSAEKWHPPNNNLQTLEAVERTLCYLLNSESVPSQHFNGLLDSSDHYKVTSKLQDTQQDSETKVLRETQHITITNSNKSGGIPHGDPARLRSNVPQEPYISNTGSKLSIHSKPVKKTFDGPFTEQQTLMYINTYCVGRSIIRGINGNIALAPRNALMGDLIVALLGWSSVMILRPVGNGRYKVIWEGLYQGFLYGEGFLGPLPDSVEPIVYSPKQGSDRWVFRDQDTKEWLLGDPRLGELPAEWKKEELDDDRRPCSWFVNEKTGERLWKSDPRMGPEALREKGVDLKVFELV